MSRNGAFEVKDCAYTALATGAEARSLEELEDRLGRVPGGSLYYHFWGRLLRPVFRVRKYVNDFGDWAGDQLRDQVLAERLALVDPADFPDAEELREHLRQLIRQRLDETDEVPEAPRGEEFRFVQGKIVVFDTGWRVPEPSDLVRALPGLTRSSIYYHVIDARSRAPAWEDDFQNWLRGRGDEYAPLVSALGFLDFYNTTLAQLQAELTGLFRGFFGEPNE
jgi:hypothetical protein